MWKQMVDLGVAPELRWLLDIGSILKLYLGLEGCVWYLHCWHDTLLLSPECPSWSQSICFASVEC